MKIGKQKIIRFLKIFGLSAALIGMAWAIWLQLYLSLGYEILLVPDYFLYDIFLNPLEVILFIIGLGAVQHYWAVECGFAAIEDRIFAWFKKRLRL